MDGKNINLTLYIDKPRSGRTPLIHSEMHDEVIDIVKKNPRQLKSAITEIQEKFGKKVSVKTLKRIIKKTALVSRTEISQKQTQ